MTSASDAGPRYIHVAIHRSADLTEIRITGSNIHGSVVILSCLYGYKFNYMVNISVGRFMRLLFCIIKHIISSNFSLTKNLKLLVSIE